jgi:hypothetical protein
LHDISGGHARHAASRGFMRQVFTSRRTVGNHVDEVIEIMLSIAIFAPSVSILLAPYVEGFTWKPGAGLEERPPDEFLARKPRVDACSALAGLRPR